MFKGEFNLDKTSLLFFTNEPESDDDLIARFYRLNSVSVMRLKNLGVEQIRSFLINHKNCIVLLFIENSKDSAMSLLYRLCDCSFSLPYVILIFKHRIVRLMNHVKVHGSFKIFCKESDDYSNDLVMDWIEKVCLGLSSLVMFPRMDSYLLSSTRFKIANYLKNIGVFPYLTGYKYIVDAIEMYIKNPNIYITKDIYKSLADQYKTSSMNIDRCMRHVIEAVWRDTKLEVLRKYYLNSDRVYDNRPSVFEFIRCVAQKIMFKERDLGFDRKNVLTFFEV